MRLVTYKPGVIVVKSKVVRYFVEGQDDRKVVDTLKSKMGLIRPGKVEVLNVVAKEIKDMHLRTISPGTMVVLVFDTDAGSKELLHKNIRKLKECRAVTEVVA